MPKGKPVKRRVPKNLSATLYCYIEPDNAKFAREEGARMFGSYSAYVNALISKDRGKKPTLGTWKAKGESKKIREDSKPKKFTQMDFETLE